MHAWIFSLASCLAKNTFQIGSHISYIQPQDLTSVHIPRPIIETYSDHLTIFLCSYRYNRAFVGEQDSSLGRAWKSLPVSAHFVKLLVGSLPFHADALQLPSHEAKISDPAPHNCVLPEKDELNFIPRALYKAPLNQNTLNYY